jgi:hypothetical protein
VFWLLVLARIIEPASEQDSLRGAVGGRRGRGVVSHAQPPPADLCEGFLALQAWPCLRRACRAQDSAGGGLGMSILYFEADQGDGLR